MLCCLLAFLALPTLAPARFFGLNARCATGFRAPPPIHVRYKHIYIHVHQFISPSQKVRWLSDFSLPYVLEGARSLCNSLGRWSSLETWHPASLYPAAGLHQHCCNLFNPWKEAVKVPTTGLIDELIFCHRVITSVPSQEYPLVVPALFLGSGQHPLADGQICVLSWLAHIKSWAQKRWPRWTLWALWSHWWYISPQIQMKSTTWEDVHFTS